MVNYRPRSLDATFAALADSTRRQILATLSKGPARVTDLAEPFPISLPAISRHLRVLEQAGLLKRVRQGREHRLKLRAAPLRAAVQWMEQYERFWEGSLDSLARFLEKSEQPKKGKP